MMKRYPSANGHQDLKQANGNNSGQLALSPQASICPPPLLGHHPMVTSLLDLSEVIIRPMKDGNGKRTFKLGLIVTDGIQTPNLPCEQTRQQPTPGPSGTRWSEELFREPEVAPMQSTEEPFEPNPPNPPRQDSPVPSLPREQTPRQPTPGPSGTRWSEDLFREASQHDEPPIPGPSPSSEPPEDIATREPQPEVAPTQSTEEPF
ncbi:hypothetical protein O181_132654, partial [Austropuccinia psidii MF-1]|nr:hypothetical protein [Austropuccinia psidii MF-1]